MIRACGWDIGGVHLKAAACAGPGGDGLDWRLEPFSIWRRPADLGARLATIAADLGAVGDVVHALTMTAELSDVFPDRLTGVRTILEAARAALGGRIRVLDRAGRLRPLSEAAADPEPFAAANWMATATLAARKAADGLLIDVGSTTTDIVPFRNGLPAPAGRTDLERLACGELVYTGFLRTPPAALADRVPLGHGTCRVAPEHFTIMADAYVLLGRLRTEDYTVETPDGRDRTPADCAARLARLVCSDPETIGREGLRRIAADLAARQESLVAGAIAEVAKRSGCGGATIIAGAGAALAAAAAGRADRSPRRLSDLLALGGATAGRASWDVAAPAVALALLAAEGAA
jgi:(4-(4-[2-(gamma-L-glutamylamino)ethyl]phenoxymethyl)furan-2-yl)methanamine synthase